MDSLSYIGLMGILFAILIELNLIRREIKDASSKTK